MKTIGVEFTDVTIYAIDQPNELYTFHRPRVSALTSRSVLLRACENAGVDIFCSTLQKS